MRSEIETTSRIDRKELLGLLDSTRAEQRVTAEIDAPQMAELLESEQPAMKTPIPPTLPEPIFSITFPTPVPDAEPSPRLRSRMSTMHIIIASFAATLALGLTFLAAL